MSHDPTVISVSHGGGGGTAKPAGTNNVRTGETLIRTGRSKDNDPDGDDVKSKIKAGNQLCSECDINELVQNNFAFPQHFGQVRKSRGKRRFTSYLKYRGGCFMFKKQDPPFVLWKFTRREFQSSSADKIF